MGKLTHQQAVRVGRIGGLSAQLSPDAPGRLAAPRRAFDARFEREVDPDGTLPAPERLRLADLARRRYYARLQHRSAETRRQRKSRAS